jgi:hypothetical protein
MIVQAKIRLYIPCGTCTEGSWRVDHLAIGFKTHWACENCRRYFNIKRISETDFQVSLRPEMETPVTVTLESVTVPKITVKLNAWKYGHSQNETKEEYESHQQYYYDEHACPTNWTSQIEQIIFDGDTDPHGVFQFVSVEDGHFKDPN